MNEQTKRFVRCKVREYYSTAKIELPPDLWMRELGFVHFDPAYPAKLVMRRHKVFNTGVDLMTYLKENAPAHVYYSAAIYKYPGAANMAGKDWLGADLIFDLDADHILSEAEFKRTSYEELLEHVKKEALKLIDFLINDFGFGEEDIELVFSGSRGYHVHIKTDEVRGFGSRERREIVDYVMATGLDIDRFLIKKAAYHDNEELRRCEYCNRIVKQLICPACGRETTRLIGNGDLRILALEGWGRRLRTGLIDFLYELAKIEEVEAMNILQNMEGVGEERTKEILRIVKNETVMKRIEKGILSQIPGLPKAIWRERIKERAVKLADRPDAPVTADIKRLIRLPTSIHGKSSLEVKPVRLDTIKAFDPLEDAVVFRDSPVNVRVVRDAGITLKGERYEVKEGEIASLPEHGALYFMCRGAAEIA